MKKYLYFIFTVWSVTTWGQTSRKVTSELNYQEEILAVTRILNDSATLDSLVRKAHLTAPMLRTFDEDMAMYDEEYLQKKRNWVSSFRFGVNIFSATTNLDENNQSSTTYGVLPNLGLSLTVDPSQLVNRKSMMRQAENKKNRAYYQQQDQKQLLKVQILNLYYEYLAQLESVLIRQNTLDAREQYLEVFEIDFRNGNRTLDELLVVEHQVYLAEESLIRAHILVMKMKSEIEILLGQK